MVEPQPSIYIAGLRIDEPVTSFTDLIVSVVCLYAYIQLTNRKLPGRTILFFRYYFLLMSIATLLGATISHAFLYQLSFAWKIPAWLVSMFGVALIERSAIEYAKPLLHSRIGNFFLVFNIIELLTVGTIAISTLNFRWVEFHGGYGLLGVVTSFHLFVYLRTRDMGSKYIMFGVFIAALAAGAFTFKIAPHVWFNHLDLSHVLMAIASYILLRGALLLDTSDVAS